eukprot:Hpha_TRINITY_DN34770_c0_g1::TRINITY_DN34770_c0_g1_i1::g.177973::m.177973
MRNTALVQDAESGTCLKADGTFVRVAPPEGFSLVTGGVVSFEVIDGQAGNVDGPGVYSPREEIDWSRCAEWHAFRVEWERRDPCVGGTYNVVEFEEEGETVFTWECEERNCSLRWHREKGDDGWVLADGRGAEYTCNAPWVA